MHKGLLNSMAQSILDGDSDLAAELAKQAIVEGIDPLQAITDGYVKGVNQVGDNYACGQAYLPELVMAGEAMKSAVDALEPEMQKRGTHRQIIGKVVLATVEGDIHEIGKTLVGTMLSAAGFEVIDLGVDVTAEKIIEVVKDTSADIVGLSALLTTTMVRQQEVIESLEREGLRAKVKVMVGGAPVTQDWVRRIEADGYAEDAIGAVSVAKGLMDAYHLP